MPSTDGVKRTPVYDHVLRDPYFRKEVYEPEADTFLLLDAIDKDESALRTMVRDRGSLVCVELGVGSGVVLTHLAMSLETLGTQQHTFLAVDINPRALHATQRTFESSISAAQRTRLHLAFLRADIMTPFSFRAKFDVLIFNPPYVPTSLDELNEAVRDAVDDKSWICAAWAGGPNGRLVVDRVLPALPQLLAPGTGVAYVIALDENLIDDMVRVVQCASNGAMTGSVIISRWTGERLNVVKFAWRRPSASVGDSSPNEPNGEGESAGL
jgi:release factor glutamine methyltransferase